MLRSGKYYPSSSWITPFQGRGMPMKKIKALWQCMIFPSTVSYQDVIDIFVLDEAYTNAQPRVDWFLRRWQETHSDHTNPAIPRHPSPSYPVNLDAFRMTPWAATREVQKRKRPLSSTTVTMKATTS
ncbi:hypothetical protein GOP47_0008141 [Adiantum capillus-veneris]|uniref:Replitron C-terminal domain-containing protein n=1 Tax=Adiantum capillus-veneris TaxID=13818 RepID=A0A9D4ZK59_ADICA|nr:hypothetical protein GOP47_0008141 [Adiantum capillus-veneris]